MTDGCGQFGGVEMSDTTREGGTPRTDAAQERCVKALEIFMTMPKADQERDITALTGDIVREIIAESKQLEIELAQAEQRAARVEAALKPFADEYALADEAGELQHWPAAEVARCKAAYDALANRKESSNED